MATKFVTNLEKGDRNQFRPLGFADHATTMSIGDPKSIFPEVQGQELIDKNLVGIYVNTSDPLHEEELRKFWWLYEHPPLYCG